MVVLSKQLVENFRHTIYGFGLQDRVIGCIVFLKHIATESSNGRRHIKLTVMISSNVQSIGASCHINIVCQFRVFLSKRAENSSQMQNVIDLVLLDNLFILLVISHIELFILATQ